MHSSLICRQFKQSPSSILIPFSQAIPFRRMGLEKDRVSVKLFMPFGGWGKGLINGIKYPRVSHRCYFRRDLSCSSGRQTGAKRWICNERKEKWGESKGLAWASGMPAQDWEVGWWWGGGGHRVLPPPRWEVVYIRSEYGGRKAGHVSWVPVKLCLLLGIIIETA